MSRHTTTNALGGNSEKTAACSPPSPPAKTPVAISPCRDYSETAVDSSLRSLLENLGGIDKIVERGATVLLKPNLLSPRTPEQAVTTHPSLVKAAARLCMEAGAARIWVGDSCAGDHDDQELWRKTGMSEALEKLPAELKSFHQQVTVRRIGDRQVPVPAWLEEVDSIISLPKLKTHSLTLLTCAIKNLYGMVSGQAKSAYHATHPSPRQMSAFLAEIYRSFIPDLTIVDAVIAMEGEGPANGRPKHLGLLLGGLDAVAIDSVCASLLNLEPQQIPLIKEAAAQEVGEIRTENIEIIGIDSKDLEPLSLAPSLGRLLMRIPEPVFLIVTRLIKCQPRIDQSLCVRCGICQDICSRQAISADSKGCLRVNPRRCIVCMCCAESCPYHAVGTRPFLSGLRRLFTRLKLKKKTR